MYLGLNCDINRSRDEFLRLLWGHQVCSILNHKRLRLCVGHSHVMSCHHYDEPDSAETLILKFEMPPAGAVPLT